MGGGILGAQFRTNVTIFDSDTNRISAHLTQPINLNNSNLLTQTAGNEFIITIQANTLQYQESSISRRKLSTVPETMGGERFLSVIENDFTFESSKFQRNSVRKTANVTDNGDGTYTFVSSLDLQGRFQQRIFLALPNVCTMYLVPLSARVSVFSCGLSFCADCVSQSVRPSAHTTYS